MILTAVSIKVTQAYALKTKTSALATNKELTLVKQQLKTKNIKTQQSNKSKSKVQKQPSAGVSVHLTTSKALASTESKLKHNFDQICNLSTVIKMNKIEKKDKDTDRNKLLKICSNINFKSKNR